MKALFLVALMLGAGPISAMAMPAVGDMIGSNHDGIKKTAEEMHELAANLDFVLAFIHLGGVALESHLLRRNKVNPMLLGRVETGCRDTEMNKRRPVVIAPIVIVQSVATVFLVGDAFADLMDDPSAPLACSRAFVALVLILGVIIAVWQLRITLSRLRAQERALADVIEAQFGAWGFTPVERDVGALALKELDVAEIAGIRGAAQGTVRAQLTRIHAKAGVSGRAQFAA